MLEARVFVERVFTTGTVLSLLKPPDTVAEKECVTGDSLTVPTTSVSRGVVSVTTAVFIASI